jgi:P27 family predicted phage terminase small subunit
MGRRGSLAKSDKTGSPQVPMPRMPGGLKAEGKSLWKLMAPHLTGLHAPSLTAACKIADEIAEMESEIAENGLTGAGPNGCEYLRPTAKQLNTLRRLMQHYEKELGITPAADKRMRGAPEVVEEEDDLQRLRAIG